jgi:hypothetical protein
VDDQRLNRRDFVIKSTAVGAMALLVATPKVSVAAPNTSPMMDLQSGFGWCNKCQGLHFTLNTFGPCRGGGTHNISGSGEYSLSHNDQPDESWQGGWRHCRNCQLIHFIQNGLGPCQAGGAHSTSGSGQYFIAHAREPNEPNAEGQRGWRWCAKCQVLHFIGNPLRGVCVRGGRHVLLGSGRYVVPHMA